MYKYVAVVLVPYYIVHILSPDRISETVGARLPFLPSFLLWWRRPYAPRRSQSLPPTPNTMELIPHHTSHAPAKRMMAHLRPRHPPGTEPNLHPPRQPFTGEMGFPHCCCCVGCSEWLGGKRRGMRALRLVLVLPAFITLRRRALVS